MAFTPDELKILQRAGVKLPETETKQLTKEKILDLKLGGLDTSPLENPEYGLTDSTLGTIGNRLSTHLADELPKNLAVAAKVVTPEALGIDDTLNAYIAKQRAESAESEAWLTEEARNSMTRQGADIVGGLASYVAPAVVGGAAGLVTAGPVGGAVGALGTMSAIGAAGTGSEFEERRRAELLKQNPNYTEEQLQAITDQDLNKVVGLDFANQLATNAVSAGVGGAIAKKVMSAGAGLLGAAALDAPLGALSGAGSELVVGDSLDSGVDPELMKTKAVMGGVIGSAISGTVGGYGGYKNGVAVKDMQAQAAASTIKEERVSPALETSTAQARLKFLEQKNQDGNITYALKDVVDEETGVVNPNRKYVVALKEELPPAVETPITPETIKPVEEGQPTPIVGEDIPTPKENLSYPETVKQRNMETEVDKTTVIQNNEPVRYASPEPLADDAKMVKRKVSKEGKPDEIINAIDGRDNAGRPLTTEQTLREESLYKEKGINDQLKSFKTEKLDINSLSDNNPIKSSYLEAEKNKSPETNILAARNKNIDERNKGVYDPVSRLTSDGKGVVEFLSSINIHESEPFLKSIRELKDDSVITLVRENNSHTTTRKGEGAAHAVSFHFDGVKGGYLDDNIAKQFSKLLDSDGVVKISVRPVAELMEWSRVDLKEPTRHAIPTEKNGVKGFTMARTKLAIKVEVNEKAHNITYDKVIKSLDEDGKEVRDIKQVPLFPDAKQNIANYKPKTKKAKTTLQEKRESVVSEKEKKSVKTEEVKPKQETKVEEVKETANLDAILADKSIVGEARTTKIRSGLKSLEDTIMKLNVHNKNDTIKVLMDFEGSDKVFSVADKRLINKAKEFNKDGPGSFGEDTKGNKFVFLNLDNIKRLAKISGLSVEEYAKFVYAHEVLGHGAIKTFFKNDKDLNTFLDDTYNKGGSAIKFLVDKKAETYDGFSNVDEVAKTQGTDVARLYFQREMIEEVIADLASGKVSYEIDGKIVVKDIETFAREFAQSDAKLNETPEAVIKQFMDYIKGMFNKIVGNEVFKVYEETKADLKSIEAQLKEFQKSLSNDSPRVKERLESIANTPKETLKAIATLVNNPTFMHSDEYNVHWSRAAAEWVMGKSKSPWLGSMQGQAHLNEKFAYGFNIVQRFKEVGNMVDTKLNSIIKDIYLQNAIGWKSGINKMTIRNLDKALFQSDMNGKKFTDAELAQNFGLNERAIIAYNSIIKAHKTSLEYKAMSEAYKKAFSLGLKSEAFYDKYRNITEFENYEVFVKSLLEDLSDVSGPKAVKSLNSLLEVLDNTMSKEVAFNIPPTGTHYLQIIDSNDKTVYFEQFNSKGAAERAKKNLLNKNKDVQGLDAKINEVPNIIEDLENPDHKFNVAVNTYRAYSIEKFKAGETDRVPFRYYQSIFASINDTSRNVGINMNMPSMNQYIKVQKDSHNQELATKLEKLRDAEMQQDNRLVSGIRGFNSIYNLGGSVASGVTNLLSIPMVVAPYLGRYKGGAANLGKALAVAKDWNIISGKLQGEELVEYILKKYIKTDNPMKAKQDIRRLIESGILKEIGDFELTKVKDGADLTSVTSNSWNLFTRAFMSPFAKTELINRMTTGIAALNTAYANGKDGFDFTKATIHETQGYYGKAGRPIWARNGIGQLLYQFKTYPMNYVELMLKLAFGKNPDGKAGDYKALAWMAGILLIMGGTKSLPMVSDGGDILDTAGRLLGNEDANSGKFADDVAKAIAGNYGDWITYGLLGNVLNMQQRTSFNNILPGTNFFDPANKDKSRSLKEMGGATVSNASNVIDGINQFAKGNISLGAFALAPSSIKAATQGIEGATTGKMTDKRGQKISDVDGYDSVARFFGFQPNSVVQIYRKIESMNMEKQNITYYKGLVHDLYAEAIVENNPTKARVADTMIRKFNEDNEVQIQKSTRSIRTRVQDKRTSIKEKSVPKSLLEQRSIFKKEVEDL